MSKVILISGPAASGKSTKVKEIVGNEKCLDWQEVNRVLCSNKNIGFERLDSLLEGVKFILVELEIVKYWNKTNLIEQFVEDDFCIRTKTSQYHIKPYLESKGITFIITTTSKIGIGPKFVSCKFKSISNVEVIEYYETKCTCSYCKHGILRELTK